MFLFSLVFSLTFIFVVVVVVVISTVLASITSMIVCSFGYYRFYKNYIDAQILAFMRSDF